MSHFNTENVTDMTGMFHNCRSLVSINLSNFKSYSLTNMSGMFYNCFLLNSLDLSNFNCDKIKYKSSIEKLFIGCKYLNMDNIKFKDNKIKEQIIIDIMV